MAFQEVPAAQVRVEGALSDGHRWNNVFYFAPLVGALDAAAAEAIQDLIILPYQNLLAWWSTGTTLTQVVVTDLRAEGAPQFVVTEGLPYVGTDTANPLPSQTSALISWTTDFRSRAGRGRTYIPGFTEAGSSGDSPVAGLTTQLGLFRDQVVSGGFVVASLFLGSSPATTGSRRLKPSRRPVGVVHDITGGTVQPAWATQRRRAVRV